MGGRVGPSFLLVDRLAYITLLVKIEGKLRNSKSTLKEKKGFCILGLGYIALAASGLNSKMKKTPGIVPWVLPCTQGRLGPRNWNGNNALILLATAPLVLCWVVSPALQLMTRNYWI